MCALICDHRVTFGVRNMLVLWTSSAALQRDKTAVASRVRMWDRAGRSQQARWAGYVVVHASAAIAPATWQKRLSSESKCSGVMVPRVPIQMLRRS